MKCALVGYGYWGKILRNYIEKSEKFELSAIYTPKHMEDVLYVDDINSILNNKMIEIVFISTPINTHFELCKLAIESGKHIFCEKPLDKKEEKVKELYNLAKKNNLILFTDYIYTLSPSIMEIKKGLGLCEEKIEVYGSITQYGNFYENDNVVDVLGVHLLSVIACFSSIENPQVYFESSNYDQNGNLGEALFVIEDKEYSAKLRISLMSEKKTRIVEVVQGYRTWKFDILSETKLIVNKNGKIESYCFDESNNLVNSLNVFHEFIESKKIDSNWDVTLGVAKLLDYIREENEYNAI